MKTIVLKVVAALLLGFGIVQLFIFGIMAAEPLAGGEVPEVFEIVGFLLGLLALGGGYGVSQWNQQQGGAK